tara:strand:- start:57 stop:1046 length:990 start_codon:yes stop_codon:yes gene_type:complete
MGRRQINPGPIKTGTTAKTSRDHTFGMSDWICVNPVPNGVMPTDVDDLTGDSLANAVEGVWYYYDPNNVCDISGHSSNWITVGANGVEFYIDTANDVYMQLQQNNAESCRVATMFMKPDGSGQFTWGEIQGIDFRVEAGENTPHTNNQGFGIAVGLAQEEICSTDSGSSTDERKCGLGGAYRESHSDPLEDTTGSRRLGYTHFTYSHNKKDPNHGNSDLISLECSFEWKYRDNDELTLKYSTMWAQDEDDYVGTFGQYTSNTQFVDPTEKVYLWVQPWVSDHSNQGDNGVIRTGAFKLWYRLRYSPFGRTPDWIEGRVNNYSGVVTGKV